MIIMLIAFIVYLVIGVIAVAATANIWMYDVQDWSLLRTIINVVCVLLVAPVCLIIVCVVVLAVLVAPFCLLIGWMLGI